MKHDNFDKRLYRIEVRIFLTILLIFFTFFALAVNHDAKKIKAEKWERFLECSKNEGDLGCDSCYYLIYGKHVDTYDKFYGHN